MINVAGRILNHVGEIELLKDFVQSWRRFLGKRKYVLILNLSKILRPKVALTYQNEFKQDGVGAQIQRILAIRSLADNLNFSYLHTPIASVAVHPLDPYQSEVEMKIFLARLNREFWIRSTPGLEEVEKIEVEMIALTFFGLARAILLSKLKRKTVLISCTEPYRVSEFDPHMLSEISSQLPYFSRVKKNGFNISLHIRWGVGGMTVQTGEKTSRQIELGYYIRLLESIISTLNDLPVSVTIFTDAPVEDLEFVLPQTQIDLWKNSKNIKEGTMSVAGLNLEEQLSGLRVKPRIVRGGDPLSAIQEMANSDILIMSRSSFSYVAGILNQGRNVYFPSSFWHKPLPWWKVVEES